MVGCCCCGQRVLPSLVVGSVVTLAALAITDGVGVPCGAAEVDVNLYRATKLFKPVFARGVFGGQILAMALVGWRCCSFAFLTKLQLPAMCLRCPLSITPSPACMVEQMSCCRTIEDDKAVHSIHSYFLLPGDATVPILFSVGGVHV